MEQPAAAQRELLAACGDAAFAPTFRNLHAACAAALLLDARQQAAGGGGGEKGAGAGSATRSVLRALLLRFGGASQAALQDVLSAHAAAALKLAGKPAALGFVDSAAAAAAGDQQQQKQQDQDQEQRRRRWLLEALRQAAAALDELDDLHAGCALAHAACAALGGSGDDVAARQYSGLLSPSTGWPSPPQQQQQLDDEAALRRLRAYWLRPEAVARLTRASALWRGAGDEGGGGGKLDAAVRWMEDGVARQRRRRQSGGGGDGDGVASPASSSSDVGGDGWLELACAVVVAPRWARATALLCGGDGGAPTAPPPPPSAAESATLCAAVNSFADLLRDRPLLALTHDAAPPSAVALACALHAPAGAALLQGLERAAEAAPLPAVLLPRLEELLGMMAACGGGG